jgi:hypothetical protein
VSVNSARGKIEHWGSVGWSPFGEMAAVEIEFGGAGRDCNESADETGERFIEGK